MIGSVEVLIGIFLFSALLGGVGILVCNKYNRAIDLKSKIFVEWNTISAEIKYRFDLSTAYIPVVQNYVDVNLLNQLVQTINQFHILVTPQDIIQVYYNQEKLLTQINYYVQQSGLNVQEWVKAYEDNKERIEKLRTIYNDDQLAMNNVCDTFPTNVMAKFGGYSKGIYFRGDN